MQGGYPASFQGVNTFMGRCNYFANLGINARWDNADPRTGGPFRYKSPVRIEEIRDGTSFTVLFSEIHRGNYPTLAANPPIIEIPAVTWDAQSDPDLEPLPVCKSYPTGWQYFDMGLSYHRGFVWHCFYTHTAPPNWKEMDFARIINGDYAQGDAQFDRIHLAARSYHIGGVNTVMADGSVRFVQNRINLKTSRHFATGAGQEAIGSLDD